MAIDLSIFIYKKMQLNCKQDLRKARDINKGRIPD